MVSNGLQALDKAKNLLSSEKGYSQFAVFIVCLRDTTIRGICMLDVQNLGTN